MLQIVELFCFWWFTYIKPTSYSHQILLLVESYQIPTKISGFIELGKTLNSLNTLKRNRKEIPTISFKEQTY